jgi:hypothetical protein
MVIPPSGLFMPRGRDLSSNQKMQLEKLESADPQMPRESVWSYNSLMIADTMATSRKLMRTEAAGRRRRI